MKPPMFLMCLTAAFGTFVQAAPLVALPQPATIQAAQAKAAKETLPAPVVAAFKAVRASEYKRFCRSGSKGDGKLLSKTTGSFTVAKSKQTLYLVSLCEGTEFGFDHHIRYSLMVVAENQNVVWSGVPNTGYTNSSTVAPLGTQWHNELDLVFTAGDLDNNGLSDVIVQDVAVGEYGGSSASLMEFNVKSQEFVSSALLPFGPWDPRAFDQSPYKGRPYISKNPTVLVNIEGNKSTAHTSAGKGTLRVVQFKEQP